MLWGKSPVSLCGSWSFWRSLLPVSLRWLAAFCSRCFAALYVVGWRCWGFMSLCRNMAFVPTSPCWKGWYVVKSMKWLPLPMLMFCSARIFVMSSWRFSPLYVGRSNRVMPQPTSALRISGLYLFVFVFHMLPVGTSMLRFVFSANTITSSRCVCSCFGGK